MKKLVKMLGHVFNAGCCALHFWTSWIAYSMTGSAGPMFVTFATPFLSEIVWFFVLWMKFGFNWYNISVIVTLIAGGIIVWLDLKVESSQSSQSLASRSQESAQ